MKKKSVLLSRLDVKAFTLIELLVVVLIIGILAAVALPQYQKAVWKSRTLEKRIYAEKLIKVFEQYELTDGEYPSGQLHGFANKPFFETLDIDFPDKFFQNLVIHYYQEPLYGNQNYPHYVSLGIKYPDFGICFFMTPSIPIQRRKKVICGATTAYGEGICKSICGTDVNSSFSCGPYSKGCLM